jgi:hypothetical protein
VVAVERYPERAFDTAIVAGDNVLRELVTGIGDSSGK